MTLKPENNQPPRSLARPQLCRGEKPRQSTGKGWEGLRRAGKSWEGLGRADLAHGHLEHHWHKPLLDPSHQPQGHTSGPCQKGTVPTALPSPAAPAEGWMQRAGCRRMDAEGWMGCIQPCSSHRHSQHQLLSPVTSICPRGRISILQKDGRAVPPRAGSRAMAQGTAPSDTARSAPAPFPPATAPQLSGEAPPDTAGRFQSLWREGKSKPG